MITDTYSIVKFKEGLLPLWHYLARSQGFDPEDGEDAAGVAFLARLDALFAEWHTSAPERTGQNMEWMSARAPESTEPEPELRAPGFTVEQCTELHEWLGGPTGMAVGACDHGHGTMFIM